LEAGRDQQRAASVASGPTHDQTSEAMNVGLGRAGPGGRLDSKNGFNL
jgi:hypothetical protein